MDGIPKDGRWRVIQKGKSGKWRTWLVATTNIFTGSNPTYPKTEEQDARAIFKTVTGYWPNKEWAILDPDHNVVEAN